MSATIESFIQRHLSASRAEAFTSQKEAADNAKRHGFTACANVRYTDAMSAFKARPELRTVYEECYPASIFLPWEAFHFIRKGMKLNCDLPRFYAGAVPPEQLPWMDAFEFREEHNPKADDFIRLMEARSDMESRIKSAISGSVEKPSRREFEAVTRAKSEADIMAFYQMEMSRVMGISGIIRDNPLDDVIKFAFKQMSSGFFVMAPMEAFTTQSDFIDRTIKGITAIMRTTVAPNDPLVIRFCKGGCLTVCAWGDEGEEINRLAREAGV